MVNESMPRLPLLFIRDSSQRRFPAMPSQTYVCWSNRGVIAIGVLFALKSIQNPIFRLLFLPFGSVFNYLFNLLPENLLFIQMFKQNLDINYQTT